MRSSFNGGVLDKVKKTFQKMSFGYGDDANSHIHLVVMNIPPLMARRDVVYERAVCLIREHLFSYSEEERNGVYDSIMELLETAIEITKQIVIPGSGTSESDASPVLHYFSLLKDTVNAAGTLLKHELILSQDEREISDFIGGEIRSQFRSTDDIFSDSEMNIYHCICELVDIAEPALKRYRQYRKKTFSKGSLARYKKAFGEFQKLYEHVGEHTQENLQGK